MAVNRFSPIQGLPEWKPAIPLETLYKALVYKKELFDKSKMQIEQNIAIGKNLADSILITDVKDKFKKDLNDRIEKLNTYYGMADLSNPDIVSQINAEFKPIVEDDQYIRGLKLSNEARNNYTMLVEAKKKNEGYHKLHEQGFMLDFQDFQNAKYGSLSDVSAPNYRIYKDEKKYVTENLMKNYKEQLVTREIPRGWTKEVYSKKGYFYDDVKEYIQSNLPQEYKDQMAYQASVEAKLFNKAKTTMSPEDVDKFYKTTQDEYNGNLQNSINKIGGDIEVKKYELTQISKNDPLKNQKIQQIKSDIEKLDANRKTLSEELISGTFVDDKLPMMLSVNKTNRTFAELAQANSYLTEDVQKLEYNQGVGEEMKYNLDAWYKQDQSNIGWYNAQTARIKAENEAKAKANGVKLNPDGSISLDGSILSTPFSMNLNEDQKDQVLSALIQQNEAEEQQRINTMGVLVKEATDELYDDMTSEGKALYDKHANDPEWQKNYLEKRLFASYKVFKENTWDKEGVSTSGMQITKSLLKFFNANGHLISQVQDSENQASKVLNGIPTNVGVLDSQGKKFTASQLQKIALLSGKSGLNLDGADLNTAEDLTDLVRRVRHFVYTNGKSMNPYTSDESGFIGGLMTAVDYVATSVLPGGEYSSNDSVKSIVAKAVGKSDPNQLTVEDFKKADKMLSDILILNGMDRETVRSGKFSGDITKVLGEAMLGFSVGKYLGGKIPFMKSFAPMIGGMAGAYVLPKLDPTNYAPPSYLNAVITGSSNPEVEKFQQAMKGVDLDLTKSNLPAPNAYNVNLPVDKDARAQVITAFIGLANAELGQNTQYSSNLLLTPDLVTPVQVDDLKNLYFTINASANKDQIENLKNNFNVQGNTIKIQLTNKRIDMLDQAQQLMYEDWSIANGRKELSDKYAQVSGSKPFNLVYRGAVNDRGLPEIQIKDFTSDTYFPLAKITEAEAATLTKQGFPVFSTETLIRGNKVTEVQKQLENLLMNINNSQDDKISSELRNVIQYSKQKYYSNN